MTTAIGQIRQFAFDGDPDTYFESVEKAKKTDRFTLLLDKPVSLKSIRVTTGQPKGRHQLDTGVLETSADGMKFEPLAAFAKGTASAQPKGRKILAVRLRPTEGFGSSFGHSRIHHQSDPPVAIFRYPVEVVVDVTDAPEMKEWAEKTARVCERQYAMINEELQSDGFKPRTVITMTLKGDYDGVAKARDGHITGSVKFFKEHPDDMGAMVHETVHCIKATAHRTIPSG